MALSNQDIIFGCIIIVGILVIIIKKNPSKTTNTPITNSIMLESFNNNTSTKTPIYDAKKTMNSLSNKYKKYVDLSVPISITDYGRTCMNWTDTNNPDYSKLKGNQCSIISSS
jgi:hypothetical protein